MLTVKELQVVHPGYSEYIYRWDYYMRSYLGAEEYREGAYLRKYFGEDEAPGNQYGQRLLDTPLQNHAKVVVDTYRTFLFRNEPQRNLGDLINNPFVYDFIEDTDLDDTELTGFMRQVSDMLSIYGTAVIGVDRPAYQVETAAQELELGLRAYSTLLNPTNVLDWEYTKDVAGRRRLTYIKFIDESTPEYDVIRCWYPDRIEVYAVERKQAIVQQTLASLGYNSQANDRLTRNYGDILESEVFENPLGYVPFFHIVDDKSFHRGIGNSDIGDVCDLQRSIYNKLSELYSNIRISSHPSIVAEASAELNGGVGAVITVDENTNIQPYLLQPTGASIGGIIDAINLDVEAINSITHLDAVRAVTGQPVSGVSLQVSRQNLNNKLADRAATLEKAEYKMWYMFFDWQGLEVPPEFDICYETSFDLRDRHSDIELYRKAMDLVPNQEFQKYLEKQIAGMMIDEERDLKEIQDSIDNDETGISPV